MTQSVMAVTELRALAGLEVGENVAVQFRGYRMKTDNLQMTNLKAKIYGAHNPFSNKVVSSREFY